MSKDIVVERSPALSDLPPSNEELEPALYKVLGYLAVQKTLKERDEAVMLANKTAQKLYDRKRLKARAENEQNLADGIQDPEFVWPEEPEYTKTTSYYDIFSELAGDQRVRVLIEVARERAKRK